MGKREDIIFPYPDEHFLDEGLPKGVLSPSGFNTYRRCPRQYEYAYVKRIVNAPGISMIKGTAIHKGAELVHRNTINNKTLLPLSEVHQGVADSFDDEADSLEDVDAKEAGSAKDAAINNITVYYNTAVPLIRPVAAEKPFAMRVGSVPFRGVIDLIDAIDEPFALVDEGEENPRIEVVTDLKTSTKLWPDQKLEEEPQLTFYSLAENTSHVRIDFLLDQKKGIQYVPQRTLRSKRQKEILIEDAEDVSANIKKGIFPRCDPTTWACTPKFCGYYSQCKGPK